MSGQNIRELHDLVSSLVFCSIFGSRCSEFFGKRALTIYFKREFSCISGLEGLERDRESFPKPENVYTIGISDSVVDKAIFFGFHSRSKSNFFQ